MLIGWSIGEVVIAIIIIAAICGILWVALRQFGVAIPQFVIQIFWILVCAVLCILAVRFLMSL